jgi:hypothetical protein
MTKIEIIEETVNYYAEDTNRRGLETNGTCSYFTSEGKMCAVGRALIHPEEVSSLLFASELLNNGDNFLKPQYRGHDPYFWQELQFLHDTSIYWDLSGLTEEGATALNRLREKYENQ